MTVLETPRLLLRSWRDEDRDPLAAMSADAEVMEHFPSIMSREESDAMFGRLTAHEAEHGFTFWAVEMKESGDFAGMVGLGVPRLTASFTPCVEVGWRIARAFWNRGYATEGARAALEFGFTKLSLEEIVALTVPNNARSRRVMEKLGMRYTEDFEHTGLPEGHPLRRHVLYRLSSADWKPASR